MLQHKMSKLQKKWLHLHRRLIDNKSKLTQLNYKKMSPSKKFQIQRIILELKLLRMKVVQIKQAQKSSQHLIATLMTRSRTSPPKSKLKSKEKESTRP